MYVVTSFFVGLGVCVALFAVAILILRHKPKLIFDKYPRKGLFYHLKYGIALLVLKHLRNKLYAKRGADDVATLDRPQTLSDNPKSYDVVSFMGANEKGERLMVTLERRRRGILRGCLYLWLPDHGLLCSPNLPDMVYFTTDGDAENPEFRGSGFHIQAVECMSKWRLSYEGDLKMVGADNKRVPVQLQLQFTAATSAYFNYNRDLSPGVIADSIARESWNDEFYNLLKNIDRILEKRIHYEQNGLLEGEIRLAGTADIPSAKVSLSMKAFRDHSFGTERSLSTIHRYVYFVLFLNDGTTMVIGNLSQPQFFLSSLKVGYICDRNGSYSPITKCNFELYSYGERGVPPKNQNFIVHSASAKYFVQIQVEDTAVRYMGSNWESKVYNQFVTCTVNGVYGTGLTEYLYRNKSGRPASVSSSDPEWYQRVRKFERNLSSGMLEDDSEDFFF